MGKGYRELVWYARGLRAGLRNLRAHRFRLGIKRTLGKISQPINSYTRFPEYAIFDGALRAEVAGRSAGSPRLRVLDVGSPKLFGLLEVDLHPLEVHLTDISRTNLDQYVMLAQARPGMGQGFFRVVQLDGRSLPYAHGQFDAVYAMSVIEHVEGPGEDTAALLEMVRVLKPGGLLLVSVPFGPRATTQTIVGRIHGVEPTSGRESHFFQRIYDRARIQKDLLEPLSGSLDWSVSYTIYRTPGWLVRSYHTLRAILGENLNGALGFLHPLVSAAFNRHAAGIRDGFFSSYGARVRLSDVYWDLVISGRKRVHRGGPARRLARAWASPEVTSGILCHPALRD